MCNTTLKPWSWRFKKVFFNRLPRLLTLLGLLLPAGALHAQTTVTTLGGGQPPGYYGYRDGATLTSALFHTPSGLALDGTGRYLYVADRDNNAIRVLDLVANYTWTLEVTYTNLINKPVAVAVDSYDYTYVLNRGNGTNGSFITFDNWGDAVVTNATHLTNAAGMSMDSFGNIYLTVQSNKLVRIAAFTTNLTTIATITNAGTSLQGIVVKQNGLIAACDAGRNGIYLINPATGVVTTNAGFHGTGDFTTNGNNIASSTTAKFNQPMCVAEAGDGTLIVSDYGNNRVKAVLTSGIVTNLYGVTAQYWGGSYPGWYDGNAKVPDSVAPNAQSRLPFGIVMASDGSIYTSEDYYHVIRKVTGTGLPLPLPPPPGAPTEPIATAGYGQVILTWTASIGATNYNIKRSTTSGGETTIASTTGTSYTDTNLLDGTTYYYVVSASNTSGEGLDSDEVSAMPLYSPAPTNLTVTATNYGLVSLSWAMSAGATSYNLKRSPSHGGPYSTIASTTSTSYNDTSVTNGGTYYYVVSAVNAGGETPTNSAEVSARPPLPPVSNPQIGYVDFPQQLIGGVVVYTSVFHPVSSFVFNNDAPIVIVGEAGSQSYYTYGPTSGSVPDPTTNSASAPVGYQDGDSSSQVAIYSINPLLPDVTIKAIGAKSDGSPNSAIVQARFQFVTANPNIIGDNAAQFTINDATANAHLYYTIDGSDPSSTNGVDLGTVATPTNLWTVGFSVLTNTLFKVVAVRDHYQPSAIVSTSFSPSNFVANVISFGFASGEASSDFVASPGQTFYAPVTLSVLPNTTMYSLQFNLTVTNGGVNPGPAVGAGAYSFSSMLMKPIPGVTPVVYEPIPPAMFVSTNSINPNPVLLDGSTNFASLLSYNDSLNLLGVGWLERATKTNLYDTTVQDLIQDSIAHDTLFQQGGGKVVVGGYVFQVPGTATNGQTYQIQIGRPSATADGIGAPGSDVFIAAPTNGSTAGGTPINALKFVTVGQRKYIAGSVYPFRWFNAGDFGSSNLVNADVEQVFQSAIYSLNSPPAGSDFFDAMDSCGNIGVLDNDSGDPNYGIYTNALSSLNTAQESVLFNGNTTTINQIAFGDGVLDVCDVYVTFRRSLDPSLTWFQRYWNGGQRVAEIVPNVASHLAAKDSPVQIESKTVSAADPQVNFTAGDVQGSAGQTIQVPVSATIFGSYPLRVLMLNLTVSPLDGSPGLTVPVQFTQTATALGTPLTTGSDGNGNFSAVWLNSTNAGLTGAVTIGTLTITIPAGAPASAAYAVHFDHASASPNGVASFPKQILTGLITLSSRTNSSYGDGIPDSWRLRWFGTVNNYLSLSNACPSGDGINNWMKYMAGVDPNTANDFPSVNPRTPVPLGSATAIHWPTVSGKQYVIERSSSLFSGKWTSIGTNSGTGTDMEFDDNAGGDVKFYRVRILP